MIMYVVVIGAGEVGLHIASFLSLEGQKVALIDRNPEHLARASELVDALTVLGNGASKRVMMEASVEQADIVVAVTDSDEVNMVACMAAKRVGVPRTIARIRNTDYLDSPESVSSEFAGIDYVIQPEAAVAHEVERLAKYPGALEVEIFAGGQAMMLEVRIAEGSKWAGKTIEDMGLSRDVLVSGVLRAQTMVIPRGSTVLEAGERVFLAGKPDAVQEAAGILSLRTKAAKSAILLGLGHLGLPIASTLEALGLRLTVFEMNPERALAAASALSKSLVIHHEGLAEEVLLANGVEDVDLFIASTGDDSLNLLASLQAKRLGARRTLAIQERAEFSEILEASGVDVAIRPRRLTASAVLRQLRAGKVMSSVILDKSAGEVLEFLIREDSPLIGVPIRETRFPAGSILGILKRASGVEVARGDTVPEAGDIAVVFAATEAISAVEKLFTAHRPRTRRRKL